MRNGLFTVVTVFTTSLLLVTASPAADLQTPTWLDLGHLMAAQADDGTMVEKPTSQAKAPPLPLHNIEGHGGAPLTPVAYLVNPGRPGTIATCPAVSFTYIWAQTKNVQTVAISDTFFRRIELSYAFSRFGLGNFPDAVEKITGVDINRDEVYLHIWNARAMLIEENSFDLPLPAVTVGAHFKYNDGVSQINRRLGGALEAIGYDRNYGTDFTLTASKTVPVFGMPLILTAGLRNSRAAQLGYMGFGDECRFTFEGSAIAMVARNLAIGYEFRQKKNPYQKVPGIAGDDDNWHSVFFGWLITDRLTFAGGWAYLGDVANTPNTCGLAAQIKYEF